MSIYNRSACKCCFKLSWLHCVLLGPLWSFLLGKHKALCRSFIVDEIEVNPPHLMAALRKLMFQVFEGLRYCCNDRHTALQFHFVLTQSNFRLNLIAVIPPVSLFSCTFIPSFFWTIAGTCASSVINSHFTNCWSDFCSFRLSVSLRTFADVSLICV